MHNCLHGDVSVSQLDTILQNDAKDQSIFLFGQTYQLVELLSISDSVIFSM